MSIKMMKQTIVALKMDKAEKMINRAVKKIGSNRANQEERMMSVKRMNRVLKKMMVKEVTK